MMQLVDRVRQVEPPQQRVGGELRRAQDVAAAVAFDLAERDQLAHASIEVGPDPVMQRAKQSIDGLYTLSWLALFRDDMRRAARRVGMID